MKQAVSAIITGNDEGVGLRALIMKQAIRYNLSGAVWNQPNAVVQFSLQGDDDRIKEALKIIGEGTPRSANLQLRATPEPVESRFLYGVRLDIDNSAYHEPIRSHLQVAPGGQRALAWRRESRMGPNPALDPEGR